MFISAIVFEQLLILPSLLSVVCQKTEVSKERLACMNDIGKCLIFQLTFLPVEVLWIENYPLNHAFGNV